MRAIESFSAVVGILIVAGLMCAAPVQAELRTNLGAANRAAVTTWVLDCYSAIKGKSKATVIARNIAETLALNCALCDQPDNVLEKEMLLLNAGALVDGVWTGIKGTESYRDTLKGKRLYAVLAARTVAFLGKLILCNASPGNKFPGLLTNQICDVIAYNLEAKKCLSPKTLTVSALKLAYPLTLGVGVIVHMVL